MPFKCNFCPKIYEGPGSAGQMTQHIQREHQDYLAGHPKNGKYGYSENAQGPGTRPMYKVFSEKIEADEA